MAKKSPKTDIFTPIAIDTHAIEVSPGMLKIAGIDTLIPKDEYLANKKDQHNFLAQRERYLYQEVKAHIQQYLPLRGESWQVECRQLSWAYSNQTDQENLQALTKICPSLALGTKDDSPVSLHHLSHFIRAFLGVVINLSPATSGRSSCIVSVAEDKDTSLQNKILCWEYLLSLKHGEKPVLPPRITPLMELLKKQDILLEEITTIKELLCQLTSIQTK